ncbi:MAG: type 1 glutamine amidotransferase [Sphingobacteriales bacterium]|nr:MAG: type 1 glutamine amidotransferase [Sphingobacteriales bacterium]
MKVHYLQHVSFEGLGYIGNWLELTGHQISATKFYQPNSKLPDPEGFDALIILGGPMNVDQHDLYPWLEAEKRFISDSISSGKIVLGICLGAQLIASSLGGKVLSASHKEIGWFPVIPNHKCNSSAWFHELFLACPHVFHWHGDRLEIPPGGGCNLLSSAANGNQAFAYGNKVLALQFHLETTVETVCLMLENGEAELVESKYVQGKNDILDGIVHLNANQLLMKAILERLFKQS